MAKGAAEEVGPVVLALFSIVLIFLVASLFLSHMNDKKIDTITSASSSSSSRYELSALLKTQVFFGEKKLPIADALSLVADTNDEEKKIQVRDFVTQYLFFFHPLSVSPLCGYVVSLQDQSKEILTVHSLQFTSVPYRRETSFFVIHSYVYPGKTYHGEFGIECSGERP